MPTQEYVRITSKSNEMLHIVKSRNIVCFLLDSDIEEPNNANMVDIVHDENVDIELWTTSPGFAFAQIRWGSEWVLVLSVTYP